MRNLKISIKWSHLAQLVICAFFLYMFCNNTLLRPSAPEIQPKEYCIGVLLLLMCYLNALVLHPMLYQRNKITAYVIVSVVSVLVALAVEFSWLYSDIMGCILKSFGPKEAHSYYWNCIFFASLRDFGLLSFTFLICETNSYRIQKMQTEKLLKESENKIEVKDMEGNSILLNYRHIIFCEQEQNVTKIHGNSDKIFFRYGSLRSFQNLVGADHFVQINRKTLVARNQIKQYTDGQLWLVDEKKPFEVSLSFQDQKELQPSKPIINNSQEKAKKRKKRKKAFAFDYDKKNAVYQLIVENPEISAVQLSEKTGVSPSTVSRILKQLKDENLITYEGSKKTGGYSAVGR